jgi:hypothetical protein
MKSKPSMIRATLGRFFRTYWIVLLLPSLVCAAQQTAPPAVTHKQSSPAPASARHDEGEDTGAKPDDAGHQGIKIHGHWKIDIKNPDGSRASTTEFENSMIDGGELLAYLLQGQTVVGLTEVTLSSDTNTGLCGSGQCVLWTPAAESQMPTCGSGCSFNLATSVPNPTNSATGYKFSLVLSGTIPAPANGTITGVSTQFHTCIAVDETYYTPVGCQQYPLGAGFSGDPSSTNGQAFTGTGTNVVVNAGQTISVTVTFSFS